MNLKDCIEGLKFLLDYIETQEANEKKHSGDCTNQAHPCQKCMWKSFIEVIKLAISKLQLPDGVEELNEIHTVNKP